MFLLTAPKWTALGSILNRDFVLLIRDIIHLNETPQRLPWRAHTVESFINCCSNFYFLNVRLCFKWCGAWWDEVRGKCCRTWDYPSAWTRAGVLMAEQSNAGQCSPSQTGSKRHLPQSNIFPEARMRGQFSQTEAGVSKGIPSEQGNIWLVVGLFRHQSNVASI